MKVKFINKVTTPTSLPGPLPRLNVNSSIEVEIAPEEFDRYKEDLATLVEKNLIDIEFVELVGSFRGNYTFDDDGGAIDHKGSQIAPGVGPDGNDKVSITAADTTPGFLTNKIITGANMIGTVINPGVNEQLQLDVMTNGSSTLLWGNNNIFASTTTRYLAPGYDAVNALTSPIQIAVPRAGSLKNLIILHNTPAGNGNDIVYTIRKNGAPTALIVTLASTVAQGSNLINIIPVAQGDLLDVEVTKAASVGNSPSDIIVTMEFAL